MKQRKISDFCTKKFMLAPWTSHRLFLTRNCKITLCKSSYLRNKTLGSSFCFHHPRTWSFQKFQPTAHNKKDKKKVDTFFILLHKLSYILISYLVDISVGTNIKVLYCNPLFTPCSQLLCLIRQDQQPLPPSLVQRKRRFHSILHLPPRLPPNITRRRH